MGKIKLTIDGREVEAEEGATVLDAARGAGIKIPTICDHKDLTPYGACRMCIVEIEGVRGYPTSCTTPAAQGMVVRTVTAELQTLRDRILELMLSGHPNTCLVCPHREPCEKYRPRPSKAGRTTRCAFCSNRDECSIREMALEAKSRDLELPVLYSAHNLERGDPFMDRDYNLCILCGRCWRICEKIHGAPAISIVNRGKWARIGTSFNKSHVYSGCTFCGSCIDICPTGTLTDRYARWYGKPDIELPSSCTLCSEGCSLLVLTQGGRTIATRMTAFDPAASLCAIGRFGYAQIVNAPERLRKAIVKEDGEQIPVDWESAVSEIAEKLKKYAGSLAIVANEGGPREDAFLYGELAKALGAKIVFAPPAGSGEDLRPGGLREDILSGKIRAALVTGDFLDEEALAKLEYVAAVDCLPSPATRMADAVIPAAVLSEVGGTYRNAAGEIKELAQATFPPGDARPEWIFLRDLGKAMRLLDFGYVSLREVSARISNDPPPAPFPGNPRQRLTDLPARFRGHYIADAVCALGAVGLPASPVEASPEVLEGGFEVLEKCELVPNFHLVKILAPQIARYAQPGQFAIVMVKETSERVPFTLIDWNEQEGSITLVVEEVGRSSREIAALVKGGRIAHVTGPLGLPIPIEKVGTVVLGGGCYGIGSIYPIARAMKKAGNRVIGVIEASSSYLFYMEKELESVCDELLFATKDGSKGTWGGVQEVFVDLVRGGTRVDRFIVIGCTFMMRMVSEATKPLGVPTFVALNPIMVDGTGMCGACRLSVGGETKFACVDGPTFDGHAVDWDELFSRRGAYAIQEIEALPQGAEVEPHVGAGCGFGGR